MNVQNIGWFDRAIAAGDLRIRVGSGPDVWLGPIAAASSGQERLGQVVAAINAATPDTGVTAYWEAGEAPGHYQLALRSASDQPVVLTGFHELTTGVGRSLTSSFTWLNDGAHIRAVEDVLIATRAATQLGNTSGTFSFVQAKTIRSEIDAVAGVGDVLASQTGLFDHSGTPYAGALWDYVLRLTPELSYSATPGTPGDWNNATDWLPTADTGAVLGQLGQLREAFWQAVTTVQAQRLQPVEAALGALAQVTDASSFQTQLAALHGALSTAAWSTPLALTRDPSTDLAGAIAEAVAQTRALTEGGLTLTLDTVHREAGMAQLDIRSQAGAWEALQSLDSALDQVHAARGQLGRCRPASQASSTSWV